MDALTQTGDINSNPQQSQYSGSASDESPPGVATPSSTLPISTRNAMEDLYDLHSSQINSAADEAEKSVASLLNSYLDKARIAREIVIFRETSEQGNNELSSTIAAEEADRCFERMKGESTSDLELVLKFMQNTIELHTRALRSKENTIVRLRGRI